MLVKSEKWSNAAKIKGNGRRRPACGHFLLISSLSDAQVVRLIAFGVEEFVLVVEVEVAGEEGDEA